MALIIIKEGKKMYIQKRIAAFLAGLLICASASAMPVMSAFADEETTDAVSESEQTEKTDLPEDETSESSSDYDTASDGFLLKDNGEGKFRIVGLAPDAEVSGELVIPSEISGKVVAELGDTAFGEEENDTITRIVIPASIEYISTENPFSRCSALEEIEVDAANKKFCAVDGVLFDAEKTTLICYPQKKSGTSYTIPDGVVTVGDSAMYNTSLKEIKLPASAGVLDYFSLAYNTELESLDMSATAITTVGIYSLSGCEKLKDVKFSEHTYEIAGAAFYGCKALKEVELPPHLTIIGQAAFVDTGLKTLNVPESVTSIGYNAMGYNTNENGELEMNKSFIVIGQYGTAAQSYCHDTDAESDYYNNFTFKTPEQYQQEQELLALDKKTDGEFEYAKVGDGAVITKCTSVSPTLTIPETVGGLPVRMIYPLAFKTCTSKEIILPEGVEELREMSFYNCSELKRIVLPQSLKIVGNNSFDSCSMLEYADLGGAPEIGVDVFLGCEMLKEVTISGNCPSFTENDDPFVSCKALEMINVTDGDGGFCSIDGILYSKDKTELICYPSGRSEKEFTVPADVKVIKSFAFYDCANLEELIFSEGLNKLEPLAIYQCSNLKSIRAFDDLNIIQKYAMGFLYDESVDTSNGAEPYSPSKELKIYAPKDSAAYKYAEDYGFEVIAGTVRIGGKNFRKEILVGLFALIIGMIAGVFGIIFGKRSKKKKEEKKAEEIKKRAAEKRAKRNAEQKKENSTKEDNEE